MTGVIPSAGRSAPVVTIPFPAVCQISQDIVINFGTSPFDTIFGTIRDILAGLVYIGGFILLIKILRSLEF